MQLSLGVLAVKLNAFLIRQFSEFFLYLPHILSCLGVSRHLLVEHADTARAWPQCWRQGGRTSGRKFLFGNVDPAAEVGEPREKSFSLGSLGKGASPREPRERSFLQRSLDAGAEEEEPRKGSFTFGNLDPGTGVRKPREKCFSKLKSLKMTTGPNIGFWNTV